MAKRRFRIEGGRYGGELVLGTVNPACASHYANKQDEVVDAVLETDDWTNDANNEPEDALQDPNVPPVPNLPGEDFYMWENDDIEHINGAYADGGFFVYEVPADGSDDYDYEKEVYEGEGILVYSREGGYFSTEEPELVNEEDEEGNKYVPVLMFHSSEKGGFACWFLETDGEDFDEFKLGYSFVETNLCELISDVYYDKEILEADYDANDTTGKSYDAQVGWLNMKWHDEESKYDDDLLKEYWEEFDDNVEYEKENR